MEGTADGAWIGGFCPDHTGGVFSAVQDGVKGDQAAGAASVVSDIVAVVSDGFIPVGGTWISCDWPIGQLADAGGRA